MNNIALGILVILHQVHEVHGTEVLARELGTQEKYIKKNALLLATWKLIKIIPCAKGGRGRKTIYQDAGALDQLEKNAS